MKGQTSSSILQPKLQRRLRNAPTDAGSLLWRYLRARQLDGCKFRRQHPFGNFILDFACLERMLVIELDGSQHAEHVRADALRTASLERAGFRVLRFWNNQVFEDRGGVLEAILRALMMRDGDHPHPSPPLEGEGDGKSPPPDGELVGKSPSLQGTGVGNNPSIQGQQAGKEK